MIAIDKDGSDVVVRLTGGFETQNTTFPFRWSAGSAWAASMLAWHMIHRFNEAVERTRRAAYNDGWKDAKSKQRPKKTWFSSRLED